MSEYILIVISSGEPAVPQRITDSDRESANFPPDLTHKGWKWYPIVRDTRPNFNSATEVVEENNNLVSGDYVYGWAKRNKTQAELDADSAAEDAAKDSEITRAVVGVVGKAMFKIVNEIRTLQSQPVLNKNQFRTWFRNQQ